MYAVPCREVKPAANGFVRSMIVPATNGGKVRKVRKGCPSHCPPPFLTFLTFLTQHPPRKAAD